VVKGGRLAAWAFGAGAVLIVGLGVLLFRVLDPAPDNASRLCAMGIGGVVTLFAVAAVLPTITRRPAGGREDRQLTSKRAKSANSGQVGPA